MKNKKILSILLAMVMIFSMSISVFATDLTAGTNSGNTVVKYGVSERYIVTIPSNIDIGSDNTGSGVVSATDVRIADGAKLHVFVSGNDYNGRWELINVDENSSTLGYTIGTTPGASDIGNDSIVLSVDAGEIPFSTKSQTLHFTIADSITSAGEYSDTLTFTVEVAEFNFAHYYSSVSDILADINGDTIGTNASEGEENSDYGLYLDENDVPTIVLLNDVTQTETLRPQKDMNVNLNGYTVSMSGVNMFMNIAQNMGVTVNIDGRKSGSEIDMTSSGGVRMFQIATGNTLNIEGGAYNIYTTGSEATAFYVFYSDVNISNANIDVKTEDGKTSGISVSTDANVEIANSSITVSSVYDNEGSSYSSSGISGDTESNITITNCHIKAMHSGVSTWGYLTVNGGIYEGYGHGGFYLGGKDSVGATAYINNVISRHWVYDGDIELKEEIDNGSNYAGMYIGGGATANNINVYVNNSTIEGPKQPIVLRGTDGEQNNTLYISNSNINLDYTSTGIRIDNDTLRVFMGEGNNFDETNTNRASSVTKTNETYVK